MKAIKHYKNITLFALILFCYSCEYIDSLTQDGTFITTHQDVGDIKHIVVNSPIRIALHNEQSDIVDISGYDNLINELKITYRNDSLIIDHNKKDYLRKSQLIELTVSAKHLQRVTAEMPMELTSNLTINFNNFSIVINGGAKFSEVKLDLSASNVSLNVYGNNIGNFLLSGTSQSSSFILEGSVNIDALDLVCELSNITHKSIGDCKITANTKLDVKSYASGNIYYSGDAEVKHERLHVPYLQSTGNVIKID
ncbi:GIN domain-containing protein [Carboxylicivirga sp. N1Y90]|uniref:GIN domain-containing protein n=1 Tax=Carboxylicivirga fragile TaxID=3417571 RepID=UPI003D326DA9|nr:DUF2807 domain-containing protein [Marinilabiliaceae bacterium N1Y90]